jgi:hypothetical protein
MRGMTAGVAVKMQTCSEKVTGLNPDRDTALWFASDPEEKSFSDHQPFETLTQTLTALQNKPQKYLLIN